MLSIQQKQISQNRTRVFNRQIKYIVIHTTGNTSQGANAQSHFNYFNDAYRGASADIFVDSNNIIQINDFILCGVSVIPDYIRNWYIVTFKIIIKV